MIENGPNLLRLLALPAFAWAAWMDYHTRRVDPRLWVVLLAVGAVASMWQVGQITPMRTAEDVTTVTRLIIIPSTIGSIAGVLFIGGELGGADAKGLFIIGLLFPTEITYPIETLNTTLPILEGPLSITAVSIVMNGMLLAGAYPLLMWVNNYRKGDRSFSLFTSKLVRRANLESVTGKLKSEKGDDNPFYLDTDALRMYLRWRGIRLEQLLTNPNEYRNPESIGQTYKVKNGAIYSKPTENHFAATGYFEIGGKEKAEFIEEIDQNDEWGIETFLDSIDHDAYGTKPNEFRRTLEHLVENEELRVLPAFPLIVPLWLGLIAAVTIGDFAGAWAVLMFS